MLPRFDTSEEPPLLIAELSSFPPPHTEILDLNVLSGHPHILQELILCSKDALSLCSETEDLE